MAQTLPNVHMRALKLAMPLQIGYVIFGRKARQKLAFRPDSRGGQIARAVAPSVGQENRNDY